MCLIMVAILHKLRESILTNDRAAAVKFRTLSTHFVFASLWLFYWFWTPFFLPIELWRPNPFQILTSWFRFLPPALQIFPSGYKFTDLNEIALIYGTYCTMDFHAKRCSCIMHSSQVWSWAFKMFIPLWRPWPGKQLPMKEWMNEEKSQKINWFAAASKILTWWTEFLEVQVC